MLVRPTAVDSDSFHANRCHEAAAADFLLHLLADPVRAPGRHYAWKDQWISQLSQRQY